MLEYILEADTQLFLYLNGLHNPFFDSLMYAISGKKIWIPLYLLIIFGLFKRFDWKTATIYLLGLIALVGLADFTSVHAFKNVFERLRPCHNPEIGELVHLVNNKCGGKFGFVSSHAANTMALAVLSGLLFSKKWIWTGMLFWAIIVSYSRIYLGVHYPLDIMGGWILATVLALVVFWGVRLTKPAQ